MRALFVFLFLRGASLAAVLTWTAAESDEWNTVHRNWSGGEFFQTGDDVNFGSGSRVFIGLNGLPEPVSPGLIYTGSGVTFWGGDIMTGRLVHGSGTLIFSNYATSLSFPNGLQILNGSVVYDVRSAPDAAELRLGSGEILFGSGSFKLLTASDKVTTLLNPLIVSNGVTLIMESYDTTSGPVRFAGGIDLYGQLTIQSMGSNRFAPDELAGPLRIKYRPTSVTVFFNGSYGTRALELSGPIVTDFPPDPLPAGTTLRLQNYGLFGVRITNPSNTYSSGTLILPSPSAPRAPIEVAAESSLGVGNVEVQGLLHLKGSRNIGTNALLTIQTGGQVYLDEGVKLRLRGLRLGNTWYSVGRFTSNNAPGYIMGPGEIRLPHYNLPPTIEPTDPPNRTVYTGSDVPFNVAVNDPDGEIAKVGFAFYEFILIREITSPPWRYTVSNTPPDGIWYSRAVAWDDEGAYTVTFLHSVAAIEPPAPRLLNPRLVNTNGFAFDFDARSDTRYSMEALGKFTGGTWSNLYLLPTPAAHGRVTATNPIPFAEPYRLFRIRAGYQPYSFW